MSKIDINCDMGEKSGFDLDIIPFISSANIACGYHAGDAETMKETISMAVLHQVNIGAHPGYDDKENFGRTELGYENKRIIDLILRQLHDFNSIAKNEGAVMKYVKLHGAMYNRAAADPLLAEEIFTEVRKEYPAVYHLALSMSPMVKKAQEMGIPCYNEVFADREYNEDGSLVSRNIKGAVIENTSYLRKRTIQMIMENTVFSFNNRKIPLMCESICVHGDSKMAVEIAAAVNKSLKEAGIRIESII
ncbi:MAG: LamB/YcsF family protein [Clostridia bacterium]|nr:LamB/YcsF family protein [Clostridia bacterium]